MRLEGNVLIFEEGDQKLTMLAITHEVNCNEYHNTIGVILPEPIVKIEFARGEQ